MLLPSTALCCGTAQEAVRDAARVDVPSRNGPGVVDACGHGVGGARRVENGDLAVALPHEAMHRLSIVSIEIPYDLPRRVDRPRHGAQHINAARRTSLPRGGNKRGIRAVP